MFKPVLVIPIFRHAKQLEKFIPKLPKNLAMIFVDDGNAPDEQKAIERLSKKCKAYLVRLPQNSGKTAAVLAGFSFALSKGFTHALQIDADGQHNAKDIPVFLEVAKKNPKSLINGYPAYDASVPKSRLYGRKVTNFWVAIEVYPQTIKDAMCGFRVYPLCEMQPILQRGLAAKRMGGDIEIVVRASWLGIPIINQQTNVIYPDDGFSNFRVFKDNVKLSLLHTLLVCTRIKNLLLSPFSKRRRF